MARTKTPKYIVIENDIVEKINEGVYSKDDPIPTEYELSELFECSRVTVRQALANLETKGYIYKKRGSGSFIKEPNNVERTTLIKSFSEEMKELGKVPSSKVIHFEIREAGTTYGRLLNIKPTDRIYLIERIRYADGRPYMFVRSYMSVDLHPYISIEVLMHSKLKAAEEFGVAPVKSHQRLSATFPSTVIADSLSIETSKPIIKILNTSYLANDQVYGYEEMYINSDEYKVTIVKYR